MSKENTSDMYTARIAIFIDASNVWGSYKEMGIMIDFNKLENAISKKFGGEIFKTFYFVAYPKKNTREKQILDGLHRFITFLKKNLKFEIIKKPLKIIYLRNKAGELIYNQKTGEVEKVEKGNFDVEMAIQALKYSSAYDVAVFFTGDSDFMPLVDYLHGLKNPKKIFIFSTENCVSSELKNCPDEYFDLKDFTEIHGDILLYRKERDEKRQKEKNSPSN